jgi:hypothetical protein
MPNRSEGNLDRYKEASDAWKTVADVEGNQAPVSSHALPAEPFGFIRLCQLPGGGDSTRPNILWIGHLELTGAQNAPGSGGPVGCLLCKVLQSRTRRGYLYRSPD